MADSGPPPDAYDEMPAPIPPASGKVVDVSAFDTNEQEGYVPATTGYKEWLDDFKTSQKIGFVLAFVVLTILLCIEISEEHPKANEALACSLFLTIFWIFEVIPVAMTSILPVIIFPLAGITSGRDTASKYYNFIQFLFIGAFLVVVAIEEVQAHKRFALTVVNYIGVKPMKILAGLMMVSFILSMFASNTSTTILLVPVVSGLIHGKTDPDSQRFEKGALLGIAYAATSGGLATIIGTVPNGIFAGIFAQKFPEAEGVTFAKWMGFAFPIALLMGISAWGILSLMFMRNLRIQLDKDTIKDDLTALGPVSRDEKYLFAVIGIMLSLFIARPKGISPFFGECTSSSPNLTASDEYACEDISGVWNSYVDDGTMSCLAALILFFVPSSHRPGERILTAESFSKIRFDMLLLFGAGFAIANAFSTSGLSEVLGDQFGRLQESMTDFGFVFAVTFIVCYFTEMTSNTATSSILIPILLSVAVTTETNPYLLGLPVTVASSLAFMLPIATPPNTVVYSTGKVSFWDMIKAGFWLNNIGIIIVSCMVFGTGNVFTDLSKFPEFAQP